MEKENQNPINSNRRKLLSLAGAAGTAALLSPLLARAQPSTIIEAGSNVDTASYIIFQDSGIIYAKNGTTGKIDFSGTDASTVIQGAIDVLNVGNNTGSGYGGKIFIKAGGYIINSTIDLKSQIILEGEDMQRTVLSGNDQNVTILKANGTSSIPVYYIGLRNLAIMGGNTGFLGNWFIFGHMENIRVSSHVIGNGYGISLNDSYMNNFMNVESRFNNIGIISNGQSNNLTFTHCWFNNNNIYGIYITDGQSIHLIGCNVEYNKSYGVLFSGIWGGRISGYFENNGYNNSSGEKTQIKLVQTSASSRKCYGIIIDGFYMNGTGAGLPSQYGIVLATNGADYITIGEGYIWAHSSASIVLNTGCYQLQIHRFKSDDPIKIINNSTSAKIDSQVGYINQNNIISDTFAIDSTGIKTVTMAHGLAIAPAKQDCCLTVMENTSVDDWEYTMLKVVSTDTTNVIAKINISKASATAGATAKLGLRVRNA